MGFELLILHCIVPQAMAIFVWFLMGSTTGLQRFEEILGLELCHKGPPKRDGGGVVLDLILCSFAAYLSIQDIGGDPGFSWWPGSPGMVEGAVRIS